MCRQISYQLSCATAGACSAHLQRLPRTTCIRQNGTGAMVKFPRHPSNTRQLVLAERARDVGGLLHGTSCGSGKTIWWLVGVLCFDSGLRLKGLGFPTHFL